jgi:hypothetical protein
MFVEQTFADGSQHKSNFVTSSYQPYFMVAIATGLPWLITPSSGKFEWKFWEIGIVPIALRNRERATLPTINLYTSR